MAGQQEEILQKLDMIGNLESVVTEQKIRIEKMRTTYETLKAQHFQLQDTFEEKNKELKDVKNEMKKIQELSQETVQRMRTERDAKIQECEEIKMQLVTPQRIEMLKAQLQKEVEGPYKEKYEALEMEIDKYRSDFNKLRYDYSFLKSEYEHEQIQHNQMMEEMQAHSDMQITSLKQERDSLLQKIEHESPPDAQQSRDLQRENAQLHMKLKGLLVELDEIRGQQESSGIQSDHVSRLQARQLTEMTAKCKSLETECDSLKLQCQTLQLEFEKNNQTQGEMTTELNGLEKERLSLMSKMDEMSHRHKLQLNNAQISLMKNQGNLERERDELRVEIDKYKNKLEVSERTIQHLKKTLDEKEHYLNNSVQSAREEEWEKIAQLEQGKLQLEAGVKQLERSKAASEVALNTEKEKLEEKLRSTDKIKSLAEAECSQLKAELQGLQNILQDLEKEKHRSQDLKLKQQKLQNQCQSFLSNEQQLLATNERLKASLELLNEEIRIARSDLQRQEDESHSKLEQANQEWKEEKERLQIEIRDLKGKIRENEKNSQKCDQENKKKSRKNRQEKKQLQDKLQVLEAKEQQMRLERDSMQKHLELENAKMRRQLEKVRKRQNRFKSVLDSGQSVGFTPFPTSSSPIPFDTSLEKDRLQQEITPELDENQKYTSKVREAYD